MGEDGVFLVGDFKPDRLGASYRRAFSEIGLHVGTYDMGTAVEKLTWIGRNRIAHRLSIRSLACRRAASKALNRELVNCAVAFRSRRMLILNGEWVMPETIEILRGEGYVIAVFHADNPLPPHYSNRPETLPVARGANLYLIWSERLAASLRVAGVPRVEVLPFGWDPDVFPYQGDSPQGTWPGVIFVGGWDREREEFLDEVSAHLPLRIFGPDYWGRRTRRGSRSRKCWQGKALYMNEAAKVLREAAVTLNILRLQHSVDGAPDGVVMRSFEVPGAGGFLLATRSGVATELFPEGVTGEYFGEVRECIAKCRRYIEAGDLRKTICEEAHKIVSERHRYIDRARQVLLSMESLP